MAKGDVTISFKDNKPVRVTGTRSLRVKAQAMAFGQAFADSAKKPPDQSPAPLTAAWWNAKHPVGTPVLVRPIIGEVPAFKTRTRSEAWEPTPKHYSVLLKGRAGGYRLDAIDVVSEEEWQASTLPRPVTIAPAALPPPCCQLVTPNGEKVPGTAENLRLYAAEIAAGIRWVVYEAPNSAAAVMAWPFSGDCGLSSKTIWCFMMGVPFEILLSNTLPYAPRDQGDFGRCHRLLALCPEWRARMPEMARVRGWEKVAPAWEKLSRLYERGFYKKLNVRLAVLGRWRPAPQEPLAPLGSGVTMSHELRAFQEWKRLTRERDEAREVARRLLALDHDEAPSTHDAMLVTSWGGARR